MSDIATLGIAIDASQPVAAAAALDKLTVAGDRAATSVGKVGAESSRQSGAMQQMSSATLQASSALDRSSKAMLDLDAELERFISANNRAYAAQRAFQQGQDLVNRGVESGLISQRTASQVLGDLQKKVDAAGESSAKSSVSTSYLTRELRALGDEAASGRMRQFDGTVAGLATRLLGLGPAGLAAGAAIVGVGAAVAVTVVRSEEMQRALKAIEVGFVSTGNSSLVSTAQLKAYVGQLSLLPNVSRDAAEKGLAELSKVPYITGQQFERVTAIVNDFAVGTGQTLPAAMARLAKAVEDPARGSADLDKQFNLLTTSQRLLVQSYIEHGQQASAIDTLIQALEARFRGLAQQGLTPLGSASSDLAKSWDGLVKSFSNPDGTNFATRAVSGLYDDVTRLVNFIHDHSNEVQRFFRFASTAGLNSFLPSGGAPTTDASEFASLDFVAPKTATQAVKAGQSAADRALDDRNPGQSQAAIRQQRAADEAAYRTRLAEENRQLADINVTETRRNELLAERAVTQDKIAHIQEQLKPRGGVAPLGLNVDQSALTAALKANDFVAEQQKTALEQQQRLDDFYHQAGVKSDREFYDQKIANVDRYLQIEEDRIQKDLELRRRADAEYAQKTPQSAAQGNEISKARIDNQRAIDELLAKEQDTRLKLGTDRTLLVLEEQRAERITATNLAMAKTQEITAALADQEERLTLQVKTGSLTQLEASQARDAATLKAIDALKAQEVELERLRASDIATNDTADSEKKLAAIQKLDAQILKLTADLDPIGQKLNEAFSRDLLTFFDKLSDDGVRSFKTLKSAVLDFGKSLNQTISHELNQALTDSIMKSLGLRANSATGTAGGPGGLLSSLFGLSGTSGSATSGGGLLASLGGLFGRSSPATTNAIASDNAVMANGNYFSDMGVTPYLHGGGIVGQEFAFQRFMKLTQGDLDAAPRFHSGGVAGDEVPIIAQRGEGVFTQAQMAKLAPAASTPARDRNDSAIKVNQTFVVKSPQSRQSQSKMMNDAARALDRRRRSRSS